VSPSEPLLRARSLGLQYVQRRAFSRTKYTVTAFEAVDLDLFRGETLALVGESGAGKSSLARCLALLEAPTAGSIELQGQEISQFNHRSLASLRPQIQLIFQDPASALNPRLTACEIIAEPLVVQRLGSTAEQRDRALHLMQQVGLDATHAQKRPFEFSGGQRQRLAIARALALQPSVLVLDEALSNLDAGNQDLLLNLLGDLQSSYALGYLFVAHDLALVSRFADRIAVMYQGKIVEQRETRELFAKPAHPYTQELLSGVQSVEKILLQRSA
jgi:peptide/nickel transport system ATP-binding protein/oligopeptide transport system ATP-binding protein